MNGFTKPSIIRIARKSGIKSMSEECYEPIRNLIYSELSEILRNSLIVNNIRGTRTLMMDDVYDALQIMGYNIAKSDELNTSTVNKK